jgi:energy-coupling factor transporter ATP-binding protein EcfA2
MSSIWQRKLKRDLLISSLIVIEGNVHDVYWEESKQQYFILPDLLKQISSDFQQVICWNQIDGVTGISFEAWQDARDEVCGHGTTSQNTVGSNDSDNPFAMMEAEDAQGQGAIECSLADILSVASYFLANPTDTRRLFVLDFSELLFNGHNALSEADRANIQRLAMGVRDYGRQIRQSDFMQPRQNVVVCIAPDGALPMPIYSGQSEVSQVTIPMPSRNEREAMVRRHFNQFRIQNVHTTQIQQDLIDGTDQYTIRSLWQLAKLSRSFDCMAPSMKLDNLLHLFKHGEQESPWENLNRRKLSQLESILGQRVKGQPDALAKVVRVVKRAFTGLSGIQHSGRQQRPKGVLFFVGPTGVGKTELAKSLANFLFGEDEACIRFDMSEYNHEHSDQRLVGAPPGYVGYEEGGQLTNAIRKRPFSVLLFDEIEKAHPRILDKFLQIVDDGRLTDGRGQTVSFADAIIIFSSIIGAADVQPSGDWFSVRAQFIDKVQQHFRNTLKRPELLNRIGDSIMPFNFIDDPESLQAITELKLQPIERFMKERYDVEVRYLPKKSFLLNALINQTDIRNGGRGIGNVVESYVIEPLSEFLFEHSDRPISANYLDVVQVPDEPIEFSWGD